jgi:hypothetical protein
MSGGLDLADWLRWVGLGCELTGLGITAAGIADLRRRYSDRPGIIGATRTGVHRTRERIVVAATAAGRGLAHAWRWIGLTVRTLGRQLRNGVGRLLGRPQVQRGQATGAVALTAAAVGVAPGALVVTSTPTADQRLDALERQTEATDEAVDRLSGDVDSRIRDLASGGLRAETAGIAILAWA